MGSRGTLFLGPKLVQGARQIIRFYGLQQIVYAIIAESLHSILVVGCGENHHATRHHFVKGLKNKAVVQTSPFNPLTLLTSFSKFMV